MKVLPVIRCKSNFIVFFSLVHKLLSGSTYMNSDDIKTRGRENIFVGTTLSATYYY